MTRRIFCKILLVVVAIFGLFVLSGVLLAQGNSDTAFERVKAVQERHTERLMALNGVEGTAIGLDRNDRPALKVFTARQGVAGIPETLDGVAVQVVVTGKFYALVKPDGAPGLDKKNPPPAAPTGLTATPVNSGQINLTWKDNANNEKGFKIERKIADPFVQIATVGANKTSYSDTGLAPLTGYTYRVRAYNDAGNSGYSNEASATTDPAPEKPPHWCERPVPIGVSTGHPDITAGTIGCRVVDIAGNVYALSNNHVYANENKAAILDNVLQPGSYDGGLNPRDAIGTLYDFQPIVFSRRANNTIDAAIALCSTETLGNSTPTGSYGKPSSATVTATTGLAVQKHGRTTLLTTGNVYAVNATVNVGYSSGTARFVNQIMITPGTFSAGGDSGSLIVTQEGKNPVGLLFAGSSSVTIANPINAVLEHFGVTVDDSE